AVRIGLLLWLRGLRRVRRTRIELLRLAVGIGLLLRRRRLLRVGVLWLRLHVWIWLLLRRLLRVGVLLLRLPVWICLLLRLRRLLAKPLRLWSSLRRREPRLLRRREPALRGLTGASRLPGLLRSARALAGDDGSSVAEHRLGWLLTGSTRLHRWHRAAARSASRCVHQHRRTAVRAWPSWSRHSGSPILSSQNGIARRATSATEWRVMCHTWRAGFRDTTPSAARRSRSASPIPRCEHFPTRASPLQRSRAARACSRAR